MKGRLQLFLTGFLMGAGDLVPGISGGTIAILLNVYQEFVKSFATFTGGAFLDLFSLRLKRFFAQVAWQFLLLILSGMGVAIFTLSPLFHALLNEPTTRSYLFATFAGLVISSILYFGRGVNSISIPLLLVGGVVAAIITQLPLPTTPASETLTLTFALWLSVAGAIGMAAMLLPGISGCYILTVLNVYPLLMRALSHPFQWQSIQVLFAVGVGIAFSALITSRLITYCLERYNRATLSLMIGFMVGSLPSVWPFWEYVRVGGDLVPTAAYLPVLATVEFLGPLLFFLGGIFLVLTLEYKALCKQLKCAK